MPPLDLARGARAGGGSGEESGTTLPREQWVLGECGTTAQVRRKVPGGAGGVRNDTLAREGQGERVSPWRRAAALGLGRLAPVNAQLARRSNRGLR
jgi:hypothetical protein